MLNNKFLIITFEALISAPEGSPMVEIADDGPGIPLDIQPRIIEQFFTTRGTGEGPGLGLSVSSRIVIVMHKGSISFTSRPGDSRFEIRLPIENHQ